MKAGPELTIESSTQGQRYCKRERNEYTEYVEARWRRMGTEGGVKREDQSRRSIKAVNYTTLRGN